jgi:RNA polymerase-interacting CarD/CdnL/TRCF family regulator
VRPPNPAGAIRSWPFDCPAEEDVITEKEERIDLEGGALSTTSPSSKAPPGVAVGDTVIYAGHGVGRVVAHEQTRVGDATRDCVVVDLAAGLRITLPLPEAAERLRAVADESELEDVRRTLASPSSERDEPWTKRIKDNKAKLAAGRATDLAEIVRDGDRYERAANGSRLSHGERRLYLQARAFLVSELCFARGVGEDEAEAWIEAQIVLPDEKGD